MTSPAAEAFEERFVTFACGADTCVGVVATPAARTGDIGVLIVVGGPQYRVGSHRQFVALARALAAAGYSTLRFDCRGMGDSEGARRTFEDIADDLAAASAALERGCGVARVVLWALCDGASAALMFAPLLPDLVGIVAVNPWARSSSTQAATRLRHYYTGRIFALAFWRKLARGEADVGGSIAEVARTLRTRFAPGRGARAAVGFLERMQQGWTRFRRPLLVVLSGRDFTAREFEAWVAADDARRALLADATVARCADADHTFSSNAARDALARHTLDWLAGLAASSPDGPGAVRARA